MNACMASSIIMRSSTQFGCLLRRSSHHSGWLAQCGTYTVRRLARRSSSGEPRAADAGGESDAAVPCLPMEYRTALSKFDGLVTDLRTVATGGGGGPQTLQRLHQVLQRYAPSELTGLAGLLPCASGAAALLLTWLEGLNAAVGQERQKRGMRDGDGTVPMPILGLYNLSKGVELTHALFFFPQLSPAAQRGIPFAGSLGSTSSNSDAELPGGAAADTTPYGPILALLVEQQAKKAPSEQPRRQHAVAAELEEATTRMVALLGRLREELYPALQTVRHVAVLYAALLELTYRPATTATQIDHPAGGMAGFGPHQERLDRTRRCKALWGQLVATLPARLRVEALLALQSAASTPPRKPQQGGANGNFPISSSNSGGGNRDAAGSGWFIRAVRTSLSLTLAGTGGLEALLAALFNGNESSDDGRALEAVTRVVAHYDGHKQLLGAQNAPRFFAAICQQLLPVLRAGLSPAELRDHTDGGDGGARRGSYALAWRKAAAQIAKALLAAEPALGAVHLIEPCLGGADGQLLPLLPPITPIPTELAITASNVVAAIVVTARRAGATETKQARGRIMEVESEDQEEEKRGATVLSEQALLSIVESAHSLLLGSGRDHHVLTALAPVWRFCFRLASFCEQRGPMAPVRGVAVEAVAGAWQGGGADPALLLALLDLHADHPLGTTSAPPQPPTAAPNPVASGQRLHLTEADWGFRLGPGGGVEVFCTGAARPLPQDSMEVEEPVPDTATEDEPGLDAARIEAWAGEAMLTVHLLERHSVAVAVEAKHKRTQQQGGGREEAKEQEGGEGACDAEVFALLMGCYAGPDSGVPAPAAANAGIAAQAAAARAERAAALVVPVGGASAEAAAAAGEMQYEPEPQPETVSPVQQGVSGRLKAGLVLEALATQRGAALCGRAALGTLLPMLECMLRKPCATLLSSQQRQHRERALRHKTSSPQQQHQQQLAEPSILVPGLSAGVTGGGGATFLSGMTAEEEAAAAAERGEEHSEAVDTLQLCLGVLLAMLDPDTEAAARSFAAQHNQPDSGGLWDGKATQPVLAASAAIMQQLQSIEGAAGVAEGGGEGGGASEELQAVAQLAMVVRLRLLHSLGSASALANAKPGGDTPAGEAVLEAHIAAQLEARWGALTPPPPPGATNDGAAPAAGAGRYWLEKLPPAGRAALAELLSPLAPSRAQGLVELRGLLQGRDAATLSCSGELVALLEEVMVENEGESFVFLAAINVLTTLADVSPTHALPLLASRCSAPGIGLPLRLLLMEAMEKAARRCGELLPHYARHLVTAFLAGVESALPAHRVSALSATGTLCRGLRYGLHPYLTDIVPMSCHVLALDPEPAVRQAAAFLLAELIEGVEEAVWEVLPDWLSLLYRTLKHAAESHRRPAVNGVGGGAWDDDAVTQRHAERGLAALDVRARAFLFPPTKVHHPRIL